MHAQLVRSHENILQKKKRRESSVFRNPAVFTEKSQRRNFQVTSVTKSNDQPNSFKRTNSKYSTHPLHTLVQLG